MRVKSVDLSARHPPEQTAEQLLAELTAADGLVEVGYRGRRADTAGAGAGAARRTRAGARARWTATACVLVTGGARGITARVAQPLARAPPAHAGARRAHAGRAEEDPATAAAGELAELRSAC